MVENKYSRYCKDCNSPLVFDPFTSSIIATTKCFKALFYCDNCKTAHTVEFMLPYDKEGFYWSEVKVHFLDHLHVLDWSDPAERTRIEESYNTRRANYTLVEFDPEGDYVFKTVEVKTSNDS